MNNKFCELDMPAHLPETGDPRGEWYVAVAGDDDGMYYLHNDLVIRMSTTYKGCYMGWFDTEEGAMKCRDAYYAKFVRRILAFCFSNI